MNRTLLEGRSHWLAGPILGTYAAAIAFAPTLLGKALLCIPLAALPLVWWLITDPNHWLIAFFLGAWLLPPLPISLGNSGPHPSLLFAVFGVWVGLACLAGWRFRFEGAALSILLVFLSLCLSLPPALLYSGPAIAGLSAARVLLFGISVYIYFFLRSGPSSRQVPDLLPVLFWAAVGTAAFACLDFYFQFPAPAGYGPQFVWLSTGVLRRAQGLFYEASTLGNLCAFFLALIAVSLFSARGRRILPLWALLTGGSNFAAALVLSYSRASLVNVMVACAALAVLHRRRIRFARVVPVAILLSLTAAVVLFLVSPRICECLLAASNRFRSIHF